MTEPNQLARLRKEIGDMRESNESADEVLLQTVAKLESLRDIADLALDRNKTPINAVMCALLEIGVTFAKVFAAEESEIGSEPDNKEGHEL